MKYEDLKNIKKVCVHNGVFHSDDALSVAFLKAINKNIEVVRSRNPKIWASCDLCVDVADGEYDHHSPDKQTREDGVPYCGFGLLWRDFGRDFIAEKYLDINSSEIEKMFSRFDEFVHQVDEADNGVPTADSRYWFYNIINEMNPLWYEDETCNDKFEDAVRFASYIMFRRLDKFHSEITSKEVIIEGFNNADGDIFIINKAVPWKSNLLAMDKENRFKIIVYPSPDDQWSAQAVPVSPTSRELRFKFPEAWKGQKDESLEKLTNVKGSLFCHTGQFLVKTDTKEAAIKVAKKALESL